MSTETNEQEAPTRLSIALGIVVLLALLGTPGVLLVAQTVAYRKIGCLPIEQAKADFDGDGRTDVISVIERPDKMLGRKKWIQVSTASGVKAEYGLNVEGALGDIVDLERDGQHEIQVFEGTSAFAAYETFVILDGQELKAVHHDDYAFMSGGLAMSLINEPPKEEKA